MVDDGDEVSVTVGAETFCPIKFHAFVVGPVTVSVRVRKGEDSISAVARAKAIARAAWDAEYEEKLEEHPGRVRQASESVRG